MSKLRYAEEGETKCMMLLKDGTKFEVPIVREEDGPVCWRFTREQFYKAFEMAAKEQNELLKRARQIEKKRKRKDGKRS